MTTSKENVFVIGASGNIGADVVRELVKKGIQTTAYIRNEKKSKELFKDELKSGKLTIAVGDYTTIDAYTKAIKGHTRLFLLIADFLDKPTTMIQNKYTFGKIAYEQGVRQIVDLSSASVSMTGKVGIIGYAHTTAEEKLWALADENPEQRSLVILRPGAFMSNHLWIDIHLIKRANKIVSCSSPSSKVTWIDTKDIADCAVAVLSESVEKHDRNVYELGADCLTHEQRAAVFSKVLGRSIIYEQQSMEDFYKALTSHNMSHSFAYEMTQYYMSNVYQTPTPQIAIIIGRPLHTLEEWLKENAQAFQSTQ